MNDVLKQRLVGALILVALGVVFWPIIFVEPENMTAELDGRIPPRPAVNTEPIAPPSGKNLRQSPRLTAAVPEEMPAPPEVVAPGSSTSIPAPEPNAASVASPGKTRTEAPVKPALDADGVPIAWILQVASVSKAEKAEELRAELLAMGYKAYTKKVRAGGKVLLRVYIGPKFERAKLDHLRSEIDSQFGVESMVVRYTP